MAHLENVTADELRGLLDEVEGKRPTQRLMLALNYKEESVTQPTLAARYGVSEGTVHNWLARLDRLETEPPEEVLYDQKRGPKPGQSRALSPDQLDRLAAALHDAPTAVGYDATAWTTTLAQRYIAETFDVEYCRRHVRRLMSEAGLSCTTTRTRSVAAGTETDGRRDRVWSATRS
ncbi:winged helix-turn-helix domain-containing protein [Halococcus sp. IIIV-5B]|uniref:winged helix-turn-helix domain-containing protein n=1 Tax=Halococcus sp. IIIV-5B TaxID=2321230 RepID=UPI000E72FC84|nr:helix-turn-helix domain-containing protein [Halococcus sp. IIIV-5B]RJS99465.1 hypothetical protein D3261_16090 [Halococcus sp. IIIV-5B]